LSDARAQDDRLTLVFASGEELTFSFADLARLASPQPPPLPAAPYPTRTGLPTFASAGFLADPRDRRLALAAVVREGVCLLRGAPAEPGALAQIVAAFGFIRETNYGRVFDVRTRETPNNLAFTDLGLAPHTDNQYREPPPGLQLLHCIETAGVGGATMLVDGFAVAEILRHEDPGAFAMLSSEPVRFAWRDAHNIIETRACMIECDASGAIVRVRVNDRSLAPLDLPTDVRGRWRAAYAQFSALLNSPAHQAHLHLEVGDVLIMDNRRLLHGRTAFEGGARWLQGCYADHDALMSQLAVLERAEAEGSAEDALQLIRGPAFDKSYGERISLRAHALEAATIAAADGCKPYLIAAALLHDIGWTEDVHTHERAGAAFAVPRFGAAVAAPIGAHVDAKRYLVASEPDYRAQLSPASIDTLAMQGGPMSAHEAERFKRDPCFADAVTLRRIDERAKNPGARTLPLEAFRRLLVDLAHAALLSDRQP
jgi:gamma-butyrobetaine dioxygenase